MSDAPRDKAGRLVGVCGLPGAGKTTVSVQLESSYGAIRLSPDEWMEVLGVDLFDEGTRARIDGCSGSSHAAFSSPARSS